MIQKLAAGLAYLVLLVLMIPGMIVCWILHVIGELKEGRP